jgi:photosystem II stability/assembly factor-like uncharacterized protein
MLLALFFLNYYTYSQKIDRLTKGTKTSLRGLCVVDKNIVWASGSNGMVARSTNGGNSFSWMQVANFEKNDFRDIEAFDSNTAIIMVISEPAYILKTIDGGKNWSIVFSDSTKGMFLDALNFANNKNGVVIGDPINNKTFIATTNDGGNSWIKQHITPTLTSGEAFFASSGSNILMKKNKKKYDNYFVSGGKKSNLYINEKVVELPIIQGLESTGGNAIAIQNNKVIIVGGDFSKDSIIHNNCVLIDLNKMNITQPKTNPTGYRSSIVFRDKKNAITCGINGVDISYDAGINWTNISKEGFHVVAKAKQGNAIFLAGSNGRIAKLIL